MSSIIDQSRADELKELFASLAGRHHVAADSDRVERRSEPSGVGVPL